ncbi:flagellin flab1 [hydrocarbon metagenome]|uniref:Flagellin flab1 n=1 Tax=hydrocarbon metagenome TaxID=938273 RepID=A0A0W8FEA4_9ZZZZ
MLIAFIVVAAVFSFAVLGTGFFAAQKSGEVIQKGVETTSTSLALGGTVRVQSDTSDVKLKYIFLYLQVTPGRGGIDMDRVSYTLSTRNALTTFPPKDSRIAIAWQHRDDTDSLLEEGELVRVRITVKDLNIREDDAFTLEAVPPAGAVLAVTRTVPAGISTNTHYELL